MLETSSLVQSSLVVICTTFGAHYGCSMAKLLRLLLDSLSTLANLVTRIHKVSVARDVVSLYRSNTLRVLWPEITIATFSGMPSRIIFLIPVRRRSWNSSPSYSLSPPHDSHFVPVIIWRHSLHTNLPRPATTHAFHQAARRAAVWLFPVRVPDYDEPY